MKKRIAIIGAGISGISLARMLEDKADVTVLEQHAKIGGLIGCDRVEDVLYHRVGGHVFNSKNQDVLDWFWSFFNKEDEFIQANRLAKVYLNNVFIDYPIEDHVFQLNNADAENIIDDLINIKSVTSNNFEDFLINTFGITLYEIYFKPYNKKIWNVDLKEVPLNWLEGKLPMPRPKDIIYNNVLRKQDKSMVHSVFYYPKYGGSQFIIDRLSEGIKIISNYKITKISTDKFTVKIDDFDPFDKVVFTGDIRTLNNLLQDKLILDQYESELDNLKSNGTTNVLCYCDKTDLSWLYIPEDKFRAHRIIYTGGFSETNNGPSGRSTCTVEFSNFVSIEDIHEEIRKLPGNMEILAHNYEPNSYVIQGENTRDLINKIKDSLRKHSIFILGRFAEWEYNNMDKCIESSINLINQLI
ncbi:protoporphyrinogen/coproporphyrinogen oxidase [Hymenobacter sp. PAMC 26628]|uniref:protoporphyrinogen/coproporphyrinogen oxidase n=1 Tax=Hymenobacter sp. PAMC 26628 TaxID=1484118 RepID=UPI0009020324|nr:NAD(P)-binding protein [Hymenobacter sp. PAMC 26628]